MRYPKVALLIETYWAEPDFHEVVNSLMLDSRNGYREGFPMDITNAIFELLKLHDTASVKSITDDDILKLKVSSVD